MGIPGLSTYMEDKEGGTCRAMWENLSLKTLPDGRLVIDGNSMCLWLYRSNETVLATAPMGGSYPKYYETVVRFFERFTKDYGIRPIVVFDGIKRDNDKSQRRRCQFHESTIKHQDGFYKGFKGLPAPPMTKEVFLDALDDEEVSHTDIHFVHGEADPEIVAIANSLGCPVLSSDSDFYFYKITGGYIPLSSLEISDDCELLSPDVDVFTVDRFNKMFNLRDEKLRFLLPAIMGNDYIRQIAIASIPELHPYPHGGLGTDDTAAVFGVISYAASKFSSLGECLAAVAKIPALVSNLQRAQEQYENIPPPSYPPGPTSEAPGDFPGLHQQYHEQFRQGCFQTFMAEAAVYKECIFRPVFDNIRQTGSQSTSLPIRRAIYHILGCQSSVSELRRDELEKSALGHIEVCFDSSQPPTTLTADEIARLSPQERQSKLLSVLQCDQYLIAQLPKEWQLPMAATMYWYAQSRCSYAVPFPNPFARETMTKALLACFVACRDPSFRPKHPRSISPPTYGTSELELVHYLAQWQCVYLDVVALNQLFMEPFQYVSPAKLFDGKVAAQFVHKPVDETVPLRSSSMDLYRKLLGIIVRARPKKRKPAKKAEARKDQPFTQNRFAILAKLKDRKE